MSKFTPLSQQLTVSNTVNVWQTAFEVQGNGLLESAYLIGKDNVTCSIRITVDGVLIHSGITLVAYAIGLFASKHINSDGFLKAQTAGSNTTTNIQSPIKSYPIVDGTSSSVIISLPVYFTKSLLIEIKTNSGSSLGVTVHVGVANA